jgi:hypothetical protein
MMELDKRKIWPYHLPELAATNEQITKAEQHLGHLLDPRYKAFLKCANGWPAFYQSVDLFGVEDLNGGIKHECGEFQLGHLNDTVLDKSRIKRQELLPIGATSYDRDLFVITRPNAQMPGVVIWFAGEEIDRFFDFDEFFLAMVEYNRRELEDMKEQ